jgi:hypothetical protein
MTLPHLVFTPPRGRTGAAAPKSQCLYVRLGNVVSVGERAGREVVNVKLRTCMTSECTSACLWAACPCPLSLWSSVLLQMGAGHAARMRSAECLHMLRDDDDETDPLATSFEEEADYSTPCLRAEARQRLVERLSGRSESYVRACLCHSLCCCVALSDEIQWSVAAARSGGRKVTFVPCGPRRPCGGSARF